jgi:hypothetical protein
MQFRVQLRHTSPNANPERTETVIEAEDEDALHAEIDRIATEELPKPPRERTFRPGWTSYRDEEFWGKPEGIEILSIEPIE